MLRKNSQMNNYLMQKDYSTFHIPGNKPSNHFFLLFLLILIAITYIIGWIIKHPRSNQTYANNGFLEKNALTDLDKFITNTNVRLSGTTNIDLATSLLYNILNEKIANSKHEVSIDIQTTSGTFSLHFLESFTNSYANITNIIVKLGSNKKKAILLNCHYDSVLNSPGANDDAVNCFIMIEIMSLLISSATPIEIPIIFLFNGAEEMILQGSHGFMSNHKWASQVSSVINLDACGTPGRLLLFQTGDNNLLLKAYSRSFKNPFGGSLYFAIFRSGMIPMQTDFYVFHKLFDIQTSIDLAFVDNNYVYHTRHDTTRFIKSGTVQAAGKQGEDLLSLIRSVESLSYSDYLEAIGSDKNNSESKLSPMVTLEIIGLKFIVYPKRWDRLICLFICALTWLYLISKYYTRFRISRTTFLCHAHDGKCPDLRDNRFFDSIVNKYNQDDNEKKTRQTCCVCLKGPILAISIIILGWVVSLIISLTVALFVNIINRQMSWYNRNFLIVGLYFTPTLIGLFLVHSSDFNPLTKIKNAYLLNYHASLLITSFFCLTLIILNVDLVNYYWIWLIAALLGSYTFEGKWINNEKSSCWVHFIILCFPLTLTLYTGVVCPRFALPIFGFTGHKISPDYIVAIFSGFVINILLHFFVTRIYTLPKREINSLLFLLSAFFGINLILACFTPLGFPFSADPQKPVLNRQFIIHLNRDFYRIQGNFTDNVKPYSQDSGIWILPLDNYGYEFLTKDYLNQKYDANILKSFLVDCDDHVQCGMPFRLPVHKNFRKSLYIPTQPLNFDKTVIHISQIDMDIKVKRISIEISDFHQLTLAISPYDQNWNLKNWSFTSAPISLKSRFKNRPVFFLVHNNGNHFKSKAGLRFYLDFTKNNDLVKASNSYNISLVLDIALSLHHMSDPKIKSKQIDDFIIGYPKWIEATTYTSEYFHYTI